MAQGNSYGAGKQLWRRETVMAQGNSYGAGKELWRRETVAAAASIIIMRIIDLNVLVCMHAYGILTQHSCLLFWGFSSFFSSLGTLWLLSIGSYIVIYL